MDAYIAVPNEYAFSGDEYMWTVAGGSKSFNGMKLVHAVFSTKKILIELATSNRWRIIGAQTYQGENFVVLGDSVIPYLNPDLLEKWYSGEMVVYRKLGGTWE